MKKRIIRYTLIFIVFYLLQTAISPITVYGVGPEYILCCTVILAMFEKERFGSIYGLIFGLFCDFSSSGLFGTRAVLFMTFGFFIGIAATNFVSVSMFSAILLTVVTTAVFEMLLCVSYAFFMSESLLPLILYTALPKFLLTLIIIIPIYFIFKFTNKRITRREERAGTW